jgi:macrolide transport system ATP-binding/permease protein
MSAALLELRAVGHCYDPAGEEILAGIDLDIHAGEMVAIVGASGSGKSTLMNILGCLDRPSRGQYRVEGRDVAAVDSDGRAQLRREYFGFVFQRYHLLPRLDVLDNVALPAAYAGLRREARTARARRLLDRLGLAGLDARLPGTLSGGQQQRVGIARALMNGGRIILADEPTGALDSRSGAQVMALLHELHRAGHTVILVTHDPRLAAEAGRVIEMRDGRIVADTGAAAPRQLPDDAVPGAAVSGARWRDALGAAARALSAHRLRGMLAALGIAIGIAAVVSIAALGTGARQRVLDDMRAIGNKVIYIHRGTDFGDDKAASVRSLLPADLDALAALPWVDSVSPSTARNVRLRHGSQDVAVRAQGVAAVAFRAFGADIVSGRGLRADDVARLAQVVVIDENSRRKLFGANDNVLGEIVMVGAMPATVVGVARVRERFGADLQVWLPYSTASARLFGQAYFDSLIVRVGEGIPAARAERRLERLMLERHGRKDVFTFNVDQVVKQMERTSRTLSLLLLLVALIALLVGGIGVMNIMLVSVSERTGEIGIRMAVGARQSDVRAQFLFEAVLVCLVGSVCGVALALAGGALFPWFVSGWRMVFSTQVVLLAVASACLTGIGFGYLPARKAAQLDPVRALARE